ncbi:hypothetical protein EAI_16795 [Harpegnathos saltator]|uniref:PPAF-2-like Clip domain-containing protein n=1 Tax=Harpegnathos saltator TaxID=610380 RepID=E2B8D9_HARSA|nr:hypothetical protein EAI_16795 [Harpegnathos saltator]
MACKMSLIGLLAVLYILTYDVTALNSTVSIAENFPIREKLCLSIQECTEVQINGIKTSNCSFMPGC